MRKKLYNSETGRLLYTDRKANEQFWDEKWAASAESTFAAPPRHGLTVRRTKKYLPLDSRILEGGCGLGDIVHALDKAGFKAEGIDYAPKVVETINAHWPQLKVNLGDVRHLDCTDNYYDGYWSFGVIEHFTEGYDEIAVEMSRAIRPGGILFLSFPSLNRFRRSRAKAGAYERFSTEPSTIQNFYQFALDPNEVRNKFEALNFKLLKQHGTGSLQCLAEDSTFFSILQNTLNKLSPRLGTAASMVLDTIAGSYAGHSSLLILQKRQEG
jgi:2-polyprenyl-3-methyl-5-hydroxy-6-metoxy-1,4-benzoquinol methylase